MDQMMDPPVVGIGASAGGVRALQSFFETLPVNTGAAYVVIIHLDPQYRSELPAILANRTAMPVIQVEDKARLQPDHVYVISPNHRLRIADHMIAALPFEEPRGQRAPIDLFFRSLAEYPGDSFAVILTGAGADGALGIKAIKEAGGIILVQDPKEAEYASMPRNAIATEVADFVLPIDGLAGRLVELLQTREQISPAHPSEDDDDAIRRILSHVRVRTGHDFSQYKRATILRRIARRAQITQKDNLVDYYGYLRDNVEEALALFSDFLISVTTFFRDPKAFNALATHVIPQLFEGKEAADSIRVWVPGCATGEETYTLAMLLLEEASRRDLRPEILVFGSDLDAGALASAREGRFPASIEADLTEDRLRRFFLREGEHYRVRRELRDTVLFASHSLLRDPPFSRLDLISCRNLLIYLDRELQQQVCNTFHYALNPGGYLFLGSSESADHPGGLFRPIDRDSRIYQAAANARERRPVMPIILGSDRMTEHNPAVPRRIRATGSVSDAALHRQMLEKIAPPSMLVEDSHRAIHLSDNVGRYLQPSGGPVTTDASELVRSELRFDLRSALHRAFERGESTLSMPIPVQFDGQTHRVYLHVKPVAQDDGPANYALVLFMDGGTIEPGAVQASSWDDNGLSKEKVQQLQEELQLARSQLRAMREESEAGNEELRAANEELQSINEEYRSTSEELETSKEELQSMNEELQTVNNELKLKLESVSRAHSDLQNLMAATDVGTLFLDPSLRIKRFTPRVTELFNITANDEGRPITDFTHQLDYDSLAEHARTVLHNLAPIEHEAQSRSGGWFLVRMRPYRTVDDKIDGVVATFVDITERRHTEEALRKSEERLRQEMRIVDLSRSPIFVWDFDDGIIQWNRGSEELYGFTRAEARGKPKDELLRTEVPGSSFAALKEILLREGTWAGELLHRTKDGRVLTVESRIELIRFGDRPLVLECTYDITERKEWENRQQLLVGELTHRVKNILAVVQSMARQTLRSGSSEDFIKRFEGRLIALANSHSLLIESSWDGADLGELARTQLRAHSGLGDRVRIHGPDVTLPSSLATPFGLIFHELATNAAKYGALSSEKGHVELRWQTESRNDSHHLNVVWEERDGPSVGKPNTRGFGTLLIERALPGASVALDYASTGLICRIDLDLPDPGKQRGPIGKDITER